MRIESLTFLRFIAALIVVIFHYGKTTDLAKWGKPFLTSGPQMVTFFFVLSGFVMLVAHYRKGNESLRNYYISRVARIAPVYLLALFAIVPFVASDITALLLSATFSQAWFSPYPLKLNSPGWSLSVEMFFYITFPFILMCIKKFRISTASFLIFSVLFYFITQIVLSNLMLPSFYKGFPSFSHDIIYYFPLSHYCSFLLGMAGGLIYVRSNSFPINKWASVGLILGLAFSIYFLMQNPRVLRELSGYPLAYGASFYALIFMVFVLAVSASENSITKVLSFSPLVFLGEISYSLYILQKPSFIGYQRFLAPHLGLDVNLNFFAFLVLLVLVSSATYLFVERPCKSLILGLNRSFSERFSKQPSQQIRKVTVE